jgi:hypothetical protein
MKVAGEVMRVQALLHAADGIEGLRERFVVAGMLVTITSF